MHDPLPDLTYALSAKELAARWGVTPHTLSQWRWNAKGPPYTKIGRKIFYPLAYVKHFEQQSLRRHTAERR
jgi:transposase-like protein